MDKWTARKGEIEQLIEYWFTIHQLADWFGEPYTSMQRALMQLGLETRRAECRRIFGPNAVLKQARARAAVRRLA